MIRYVSVFVLTLLVFLSQAGLAQAHVLLRDDTVNIGAVLHIKPDDNPIAGEISELYFDIQDKNSSVRIPYSGYDLIVTDEANQSTTVATEVSDSTVIAKYNFPTQGLYRLELKSKAQYDQFQKVSMQDSLRVERGVVGGAAVVKDVSWAQTGLVIGLAGIGVLLLVAWNNRVTIARQSTW